MNVKNIMMIALLFLLIIAAGLIIRWFVTTYIPAIDSVWFAAIVSLAFIPLIKFYLIKFCQ